MKYLVLFLLTAFISHSALAQSDSIVKPSHYVLPGFVKGIVKLKTGTIIGSFNYNSYLESMVIDLNDGRRKLGSLETIDTVYLGKRKFIPAGKVFYEVVNGPSETFFIQHTCSIKTPGQAVGYGGTSQLSNVSSPATKDGSGLFFKNYLPQNYVVAPQQTVFVKKHGRYFDMSSSKKVAELYPSKAEAIKVFVKANKTDFYNAEDVKKLVLEVGRM